MANNLLLVDESPLIHRVVELTFEGHDVSVYSADDVEEAMTLARSLKPDIVIASTHIKHGDGIEFCRALHDDSELAQIPVLLLAGTRENLTKEAAQEAGAVNVLTKPFEPENLLSEVGIVLSWTTTHAEEPLREQMEPEAPNTAASAVEERVPESMTDVPEPNEPAALSEESGLDTSEEPMGEEGSPENMDFPDLSDTEVIEDLLSEPIDSEGVEEGKGIGPDIETLSETDIEEPSMMDQEMSEGFLPEGQEEEDLFDDIDLEDLFEEYESDTDLNKTEKSPPESSQDTISSGIEGSSETSEEFQRKEPFDDFPSEETEEASSRQLDESSHPEIDATDEANEAHGQDSRADMAEYDDSALKDAEDELATIQAELSADLAEIGKVDFEEDQIREAEEELASLEAELAAEQQEAFLEGTVPLEPEVPLDIDTDSHIFDMAIDEMEIAAEAGEEVENEDELADALFLDEEDDLRGKLSNEPLVGEGTSENIENSPPEMTVDFNFETDATEEPRVSESIEPEESSEHPDTFGKSEILGPPESFEVSDTDETIEMMGMPDEEVPKSGFQNQTDAKFEAEAPSPLMGETSSISGQADQREFSSGEAPKEPAPGEKPIEPLIEESLEKTIEAIVPAILRRIESIIVERLPETVEKIVLREIEKIKRGE